MHKLQVNVAPTIFNPRALYDGKALLYASRQLNLPAGGSGKVSLSKFNNFNVPLAHHVQFVIDLPDLNREPVVGQRGVYTVAIKLTNSEPIRPS